MLNQLKHFFGNHIRLSIYRFGFAKLDDPQFILFKRKLNVI